MCDKKSVNNLCWLDVLTNPKNVTLKKKKDAFHYVREHFMEISKNDDFLKLNMETIKELLKSDDLKVKSEEVVFVAVKRWFDYNKIKPKDNLKILLEVVRMPYLSVDYLMKDVFAFVGPYENCHSFIAEALRWHLNPEKRPKMVSNRTKPRKLVKSLKILSVGSSSDTTSAVIELYDSTKFKWRELKRLNILKRNYCSAIVNDKLMLVGGFHNEAVKTVEAVDMVNGSITQMSPLNEARHNLSLGVIGEGPAAVLYAVGGHGSVEPLKTVERFDPVARRWSFVAPLSVARNCLGVAVLNNKMYAAGGFNGTQYYNILEMYDPTSNLWVVKRPLNQTRSLCSLTAAGKYLYAIAGYIGSFSGNTEISTVERYDPNTDRWTFIASVSTRGLVGAGVLGDVPISVGGISTNIVEVYDEEKDRWNRLAPMNVARAYNFVVQVPKSMSYYKFNW